MAKRMLISALWFLALWGAGGVLHFMLDVPRALTFVPAVAVATAVWIGLARHETWRNTGRAPISAASTMRSDPAVRATAPEARG